MNVQGNQERVIQGENNDVEADLEPEGPAKANEGGVEKISNDIPPDRRGRNTEILFPGWTTGKCVCTALIFCCLLMVLLAWLGYLF